jgi:hypothetical protein
MPYVCRDQKGEIQSVHAEPTSGGSEYLGADDPAMIDYLSRSKDSAGAKLALSDTDAEFARVTEDLIHLLVEKQIILFTELPQVVQRKLLVREQVRECLRPAPPSILSDDETL